MSRLRKLKLENIKNANELLDKGHITKYPPQEIKLKSSGNVTKNTRSFVNKMNNLRRGLNEQSGFVNKQESSDSLKRFNKRQGIEEEELGGMTSDPRVMKKEYGNPDEDIYANFKNQMQTKEINRDEIIKILNQIHTLQHEDAPAIAQRRLEELFEKVGIGTNIIDIQEQISMDTTCIPKDDIVKTFNALEEDENGCVTVDDLTESMSALISIYTIEDNKPLRK